LLKNHPQGYILVVFLLGKKRLKEVFHAVGLGTKRPNLDAVTFKKTTTNVVLHTSVLVSINILSDPLWRKLSERDATKAS